MTTTPAPIVWAQTITDVYGIVVRLSMMRLRRLNVPVADLRAALDGANALAAVLDGAHVRDCPQNKDSRVHAVHLFGQCQDVMDVPQGVSAVERVLSAPNVVLEAAAGSAARLGEVLRHVLVGGPEGDPS